MVRNRKVSSQCSFEDIFPHLSPDRFFLSGISKEYNTENLSKYISDLYTKSSIIPNLFSNLNYQKFAKLRVQIEEEKINQSRKGNFWNNVLAFVW